MKKIDLLFLPKNSDNYVCINKEFLDDMEVSSFRNILSANEYEIFINVISKPLIEEEKICERQNIFRDLIKYSQVAEKLIAICDQAQENIMPRYDLMYRSIPPKRKLIDYFKVLNQSFDIPDKLLSVVKDRKFTSNALSDLRKQLDINNEINTLKERIEYFIDNLLSDNISLQIDYGKTFKLQTASIYGSGYKISKNIRKRRFQKKQNPPSFSYGYDFIAVQQINKILESAVDNLSHIIYQLNSHILSFCSKLSMQLSFYTAGIKIIKYFQNLDTKITFPKIHSQNFFQIKALQDMGLILKRNSSIDVITNDFNGDRGYFYLISGVNQGGKTTFLKSIGLSQIFTQNGMPITAEEYLCPLFKNFISHFPHEEKIDFGKLAEELSRFKRDIPLMTKDALILMNESFASTTEKEGAEIAVDTLKALSLIKPWVFFVTHNYILLQNRNKYQLENNIKFKSLITVTAPSKTSRTYKIAEGEPQEEINTIEFLKAKYIKS